MKLRHFLAEKYANWALRKESWWMQDQVKAQKKWFEELVRTVADTEFGKDHGINGNEPYPEFRAKVPIRDYEGLRPYVEKVVDGKADVLWKGRPQYLAKTSGTTSGAKWIPLTKESMPYHIKAAKLALLSYIKETGNSDFSSGKMIFLQGSPELTKNKAGLLTGRLSGIVAHHVPGYLQKNRVPTMETNCIEDWEQKVETICKETIDQRMTLISGIPSWVQMYYEKLLEMSGKSTIKEVFPDLSLFVYGGVNFEPYRSRFEELMGGKVDSVETFPASEGFVAFQDSQTEEGLLLYADGGIFYEFIEASRFNEDVPPRIMLEDVELGKDYVLIINSNAGLWGYNIGDTVRFVSKDPYRLVVSGRLKHFTSAFGEHVIAKEVETAMKEATRELGVGIVEFTVAPQVNPEEGLPYHEWWVEFEELPKDMDALAAKLDEELQGQNIYYKDLIVGKVLRPLVIRPVEKGGFNEYMSSIGKLGGQNKIPRLSNDRKIADGLKKHQG